jgi:hypothetical protein
MNYFILFTALAALFGFQTSQAPPSRGEAFSHQRHSPLKMKCTACHATAEKEESASFPEIQKCRTCHVDMSQREIPAARVYALKEFVSFSHGRHSESKIGCASCHGEVMKMDNIQVFRPTTMASCVACHKEHKASVACNTCHELGQ